ncbi:hirsutellin A toxin [Penicillium atrosanguineum]|uniref:Hirsutellin A toxin n=1 Tax=Penicillium atrosanguineum TaxID=1132637 RepID=A0A9W9UC17_9EURO|nr:uncharacterized protein N7443_000780 [Penicillium atrosanguineum]KAJ5127426.1 hirsutellin A toxin [Penicillium atrosanguineum]KAJ5313896.1 hypothetical protein N7443_000780 [Penicillium atrosanguineum]KAJ5331067.1 hirsutellin A toxin [Penicillium atrosanguineum]
MKLLASLVTAVALNASVLAASATDSAAFTLEERAPPKLNSTHDKLFKVDVAVAKTQAKKAGLTTGKSGEPHRYYNGDHIHFGVHNCDKRDAILWEYPIYWVDKRAEWEKDVKTTYQKGGPTPIRAVYANSNGGIEYCGVMTYTIVNDKNQGSGFFTKCS